MVLGAIGEFITAAARRALAKALFAGFWERGISANKALDELRNAGLGYRRQDFLADFREGKGSYDQATRIRNVNLDKVPSDGILEPKGIWTGEKYSFLYRADGQDALTGDDRSQYFFVNRDSVLSRGEMEDDAADWLEGEADRYAFNFSGVTIVEGYINNLWQ